MFKLSPLLVQPPLDLSQVGLEVALCPLQLTHEPLQFSLGEVVPIQREGIGDEQELVVLDLQLDLEETTIQNNLLAFFNISRRQLELLLLVSSPTPSQATSCGYTF
jgi:hypothetical protein